MRSLPFPQNSSSVRENAHLDITPVVFSPSQLELSNGFVPIDPALIDGSQLQDTKLQEEENPVSSPLTDPLSPAYTHTALEGPQGDPFQYVETMDELEDLSPQPKHWQRKRKPPKCSHCKRTQESNRVGVPEAMLTCAGCKKNGHPSCMELECDPERIRTWQWKCVECKECEVCQTKGDDARILFCDVCDRGWHMDCLKPPLTSTPIGKWACPSCPDVEFPPETAPQPSSSRQPFETHLTMSSAPNCTHNDVTHTFEPPVTRSNGKGKQRMVENVTDEEVLEGEEEEGDDDDSTSTESDDDDDGTATYLGSVRGGQTLRIKPVRRSTKRPSRTPQSETSKRGLPLPPSITYSKKRVTIKAPKAPLKLRLRIPAKPGSEPLSPKKDIFEDILAKEDSDVSQTSLKKDDRDRFEKAKLTAENKILTAVAYANEPTRGTSSPTAMLHTGRLTRQHNPASTPISLDHLSLPTLSPVPSRPSKELRIRTIRFGQYDIDTWYDAPFPEEYSNLPEGRLWYCENCLKYMRSKFTAGRHRTKCKVRHPPGDEIYRDGSVSIFEVDGRKHKAYCQNLCLLSKMFLDHKSLFYDVEPFLFYVITDVEEQATSAKFVGYFSKEKSCPKNFNVSCIMTLPVRQRKGWGNLLIDFSYLLSKRENRPGSPEKPLSALGALSYKRYWILAVYRYLVDAKLPVTLEDIQANTAMTLEDIYNILVDHDMITIHTDSPANPSTPNGPSKNWRNRKKNLRRTVTSVQVPKVTNNDNSSPPFVPPHDYNIHFDREYIAEFLANYGKKGNLLLQPDALRWTPYLLVRHSNVPAVEAGASLAVRDTKAPAQGWQCGGAKVQQPPGPLVVKSPRPQSQLNGMESGESSKKLSKPAEQDETAVDPPLPIRGRLLRSRSSRSGLSASKSVSLSRSPSPRRRTRNSVAPRTGEYSDSSRPLRKRRRVESSPEVASEETTPYGNEPFTPGSPDAPTQVKLPDHMEVEGFRHDEPSVCFDGPKGLPVREDVMFSQYITANAVPAAPHSQPNGIVPPAYQDQANTDEGGLVSIVSQNGVQSEKAAVVVSETPVKLEQGDDSHNNANLLVQQERVLPSDLVVKSEKGQQGGYNMYDEMDLGDEDADGEEDAEGEYDPDAFLG